MRRQKPDHQLALNIDVPQLPPAPRSKRIRVPAPPDTDRRVRPASRTDDGGLIRSPQVACCGFCGTSLTIDEDVAICPSCGSIVARPEEAQ